MSNQPDEVTRRRLTYALFACIGLFTLDVVLGIRASTLLNFNPKEVDASVYRVLVAVAIWALSIWYMMVKGRGPWRFSRAAALFIMLFAVGWFSVRHTPRVLHIAKTQLSAELQRPMHGDPDVETGTLPEGPALMPPQTPVIEGLDKMSAPTQKRRTATRTKKDESVVGSILRWLNENSKPAPLPGEPDPWTGQ